MEVWKSKTITVDGIELLVQASAEGITIGKTVDGVYSSDMLLQPETGSELADAIDEAVAHCLAARGA